MCWMDGSEKDMVTGLIINGSGTNQTVNGHVKFKRSRTWYKYLILSKFAFKKQTFQFN